MKQYISASYDILAWENFTFRGVDVSAGFPAKMANRGVAKRSLFFQAIGFD